MEATNAVFPLALRRLAGCVRIARKSILFVFLATGYAQAQHVASQYSTPSTYTSAGEVLTFTVIMDSGNELVENPSVTSSLGVTYNCTPQTSTTTGVRITCTGTYTVQASDIGSGRFVQEVGSAYNRGNQYAPQVVIRANYLAPNAAPSASASASQTTVTSGTQVQLLGSGTDTDGTIQSYAWTRTGGTGNAANAVLSSASAQNPTFTDNSLTPGNAAVTHVFGLVVTDDDGAPSSQSSVTITINPPLDTTAPVVTVPADIAVSTDAGKATAVVTFSTSANDDIDGAITPVITTLPTTGLTSGSAFPVGVTTVTAKATDSAGNTGSSSFTVTVSDTEAPVIRPVSNASFESDPGGTRSIGFSTIVDDNVDTGISPVFSLDGVVINSPYAFPIGDNLIKVNATDSKGNAAAEIQFTITITPGVAPDVPVITTSIVNSNRSMTIGGTAEADSTVRVTFPDSSVQSVTATGGSFSITSAGNMQGGTVSVTATDARGYTSPAATVDLFPDYDRPTVTITGAPSRVIDITPFSVTITFSEVVTGFVQGDLAVTGGTVTAFAGTGAVYTAEITPIVATDITISIAAGAAQDAFANTNLASNVIAIVNDALSEIEKMISQAALLRNQSLIRARPPLRKFFLGSQMGSFNASVTQGAGNFDFETSPERPVWAAGQGQWSTEGTADSSFANLAFGTHYQIRPNVLVGAMAQFDHFASDDGAAEFEGTGWMVGPYAVARMSDQPLIFSASYLVGRSDNTFSPLGTYEDTFGSDRVLATLGMAGEIELPSMTLIPLLDLAYASDQNEAYVDGASNPVRSVKTATTTATLGLDFVMPIATERGVLDLLGGIGATSARDDDSAEIVETTRGQADLGFRYGLDNGGQVSARATYDGIGQDDYEAYGAEVIYELRF